MRRITRKLFLSVALPPIDWPWEQCPHTTLKAHRTAVGLPSDGDMGNSEVGHKAIGCGRVYSQGAKLVDEAIASGRLFEGPVWRRLVDNAKKNESTLHFIGLFSDGNVHSNIAHLKAMLEQAKREGVKRRPHPHPARGRDVGETSALESSDPSRSSSPGSRMTG